MITPLLDRKALCSRLLGLFLVLSLVGIGGVSPGASAQSTDPLDTPATLSPLAQRSPISGISSQAANVIAVGPRGTVLVSSDRAHSWRQVPLSLSADMATVRFSSADTAWAVGHDGVVLRSDDAGSSWQRVLDGRSLLTLLLEYYGGRASLGDEDAAAMVREIEGAAELSATPGVLPDPFLDVWFNGEGEGFVVGAFGLILHSLDGGKSWEPWIERAENNRRLHFYAITAAGDEVYLAGEQGLLRRLDRENATFVTLETPYGGTYFGVHAAADLLIAYGLRGNAYVSRDGGQQWQPVELGTESSIVAVVSPERGRLLFIAQSGQVLASDDGARTLTELTIPRVGEVLAATMVSATELALTRHNGVRVVHLPE